jgi:hypothetical protein
MAFMDDVDALIKPDDLVQCLNEHPSNGLFRIFKIE